MKVLVFLSLIAFCYANQCSNPTLSDVQTYTTRDARLNTDTAYVVQFRLKCSNNVKNVQLFSEVNGKFLASSTTESGDLYQFSWTEPTQQAKTGQFAVRVYDEEGFANLKRAQRNSEDSSKVKVLSTVTVSHPGSSKGPFIQTEYLVTVLFVAIFYWALSTRSKIQA